MVQIKCTKFLMERQTPQSRFSHYGGSWENLESLTMKYFKDSRPGYREGVRIVTVPPKDFWCGVVRLHPHSKLSAYVEARREGEQPVVVVEAVDAHKVQASAVEIVVYRVDLLDEFFTPNVEYGIVSINARLEDEPQPQNPVAMARNFLNLPGGTPAGYTPDQFARAIWYWATHAMIGGSNG